jgi:hypothetical protein
MPTPPPPAMKARICRRAAGARGPWNKWRGPVAGVAKRRTQWGGGRLCRESPLSPMTDCGTVCRWRVAGGNNPGASERRGFGAAHRVVFRGRAGRLSTATRSTAEGPRARQGGPRPAHLASASCANQPALSGTKCPR